jgi:hypothetical protein
MLWTPVCGIGYRNAGCIVAGIRRICFSRGKRGCVVEFQIGHSQFPRSPSKGELDWLLTIFEKGVSIHESSRCICYRVC